MSAAITSPREGCKQPGGISTSTPPFDAGWVPRGYVGPVALPGTGRMIWWTGRIAIGLRYAPKAR